MLKNHGLEVIHIEPKPVEMTHVEGALAALRKEGAALGREGSPILRACTLTLVVLCDRNEEPKALESLCCHIVTSNPARLILIAQGDAQATPGLETQISAYYTAREGVKRLIGEEIIFYPHGAPYDVLSSAVLALRVSGLPFALYWRGQPDLDDKLFAALVGECDQILFDSVRFTARAERVNRLIFELRVKYPHVSFGDVNWPRILPWRELVAQFFDDPANWPYLDNIRCVEIEFSRGAGGNQSQALLLMGWLAGALGWHVVHGSYQRDDLTRSARFVQGDHQVWVTIRLREQEDCLPGSLTGVRIEARGEPDGIFQIKRTAGGFVEIVEIAGSRTRQRCATLVIPAESAVIASELDARRRDRNYHRALKVLADLIGSQGAQH